MLGSRILSFEALVAYPTMQRSFLVHAVRDTLYRAFNAVPLPLSPDKVSELDALMSAKGFQAQVRRLRSRNLNGSEKP